MRLLAIDRTGDAANLGGMVRSASAFGADAVLLSHDSCDPWYRRAVRVSMGHVCRVPVVRSNFTLPKHEGLGSPILDASPSLTSR